MGLPAVGVAIPTLNSAGTLATALASLCQQADCTVSVVVADSGSSDGTLETCRAFGVRTMHVPPGNMYAAINTGLRSLDTAWVAYLNSDDFVFTDAYARMVAAGESAGAGVVYGDADYVDVHGRYLYSLYAPSPAGLHGLFARGILAFLPHGAVFRKSLFDELGGFDERYRHIADLDFFARARDAGRRLVRVSSRPVAAFRIHSGQISRTGRRDVRREMDEWLLTKKPGLPLSVWAWKLGNVRQYALRWLRTGSLKGYASM